jgi:hypothetical protein
MKRLLVIGITGGITIVSAALLYFSRPVIEVTEDTLLWRSEYDASRQATSYPGPGMPRAVLKSGDRLKVLRTVYGKDYLAYFVVAPHWRKGWLLYGQRGFVLL